MSDEIKNSLLAEIRDFLRSIRATQQASLEEADRLTRSITRLTRVIEEEDTGVNRLEEAEHEERKRRHAAVVGAIDELRDAFKELVGNFDETSDTIKRIAAAGTPALSRDHVVAIARMLVDELRQGLALRAIGASPWPTAVPDSSVAVQAKETGEEKKPARTIFRLGHFEMRFPDPSLKTLWWLAKVVAMLGLAGVGGVELVKKIIKLASGGE